MLRSLFLLLFFIASLHALSNSELLKRADKYAKSSNKTSQFRAYNDYKNLYLQALMNEDSKLKRSALKGIVKTGNRLHIDVSRYSKELSSMHTKKKIHESSKKVKKSTKKSPKLKVRSSHKLKNVRWHKGNLILEFDKELRSNQINYFTLYDKKKRLYKYVFDIHASMLNKTHTLRKSGIDNIKLAQYNPTTLRLVLENHSKLAVRFKKDTKSISISMKKASKVANSTTVSKISKKVTNKPSYKKYNTKTIVIDAGHGGKDPGALGYRRYREKVVVLQIAQKLKKILKARGYKVYMTRDRDNFVKLRNRTKYANAKHADLFISIHANAVNKKDAKKVHGIECYFLATSRSSRAKKVAAMENSADLEDMDFYGKQCLLNTINSHNIIAANKLAIDLQRGTLASLQKHYKDVKDGGVREGPFWVLVGAQMPAVLVEVGFITHPMEAKRLADSLYQQRLATGLANGIERYFINN